MNRLKRSRVTLTAEEADLEAAIQEFIYAGNAMKDLLKKVVS
jgi:alkyl sulfatase BDS1-like metallo-beta-lactamase superfamily hydrolase